MLSHWVIEAGLKMGLFQDYNENEITENRYLREFFVKLHKSNKNMKSAIENYVLSSQRKEKM